MALLQDFDPPLPKRHEEKSKNLIEFKQHYLSQKDKLFLATNKVFQSYLPLNNFFVGVKNFIIDGKFLPHVVVVVLGLIVAVTNLSQKITAASNSIEFVNINPDAEYSVAQGVDQYTPLINNDGDATQKSILASSVSDGFISNAGTVSTEITVREEPTVMPTNVAQTIQYTVNAGDTLSGLGMKFDVKVATLKYVNNIDNENSIKPGVKIKIPPKGYEVSAAQIAKKEKEKQQKLAQSSRNTVTRSGSSGRASGSAQTVRQNPGSRANGYPYGWCTYYVATRRFVPTGWGNARSWLSSAKRSGYATGSEPTAGAIVVTSESGWGHVAYVESVNGNTITISEMNYEGWGVTSRRTISADAGVVRGFVY